MQIRAEPNPGLTLQHNGLVLIEDRNRDQLMETAETNFITIAISHDGGSEH